MIWFIKENVVAMIVIVFLVAALLIGAITFVAARDVVIRNDGGGFVNVYADRYRQMRVRGDRPVIDGWCASACTLVLALPRACVTPRAVMGFHSAYTFGWFGDWSKWRDPVLTTYFMAQYPPKIRAWLIARGGLTPDLKIVRGNALAQLVKRCG